jgi:hypothetical protein
VCARVAAPIVQSPASNFQAFQLALSGFFRMTPDGNDSRTRQMMLKKETDRKY